MAGKTTSKSGSGDAPNSVVKVTDAEGRVHFTGRHSALATAPGAKVAEVTDDDADLSTPGGADTAGTSGS